MNKYYVYRHTRNDTNQVFYIGKGHGKRAYKKTQRSKYWQRVVEKAGFSVEILAENLTEDCAFELEMFLILEYKRFGVVLCNLTDGGEGSSGYKHTQQSRNKLSEIAKARVQSDETKLKIGASLKGRKQKPFSEEHKLKLSISHKGKPAVNKGVPMSEEQRAKLSKAKMGKPAWNKGVPASEQQKLKQSITMKNKLRLKKLDK